MTSTIDKVGLRPAMTHFFQLLGTEMPTDFDIEMDYTVELIAEADTLIPHSLHTHKTINTTAIGNQPAAKRVEINHQRYRYN